MGTLPFRILSVRSRREFTGPRLGVFGARVSSSESLILSTSLLGGRAADLDRFLAGDEERIDSMSPESLLEGPACNERSVRREIGASSLRRLGNEDLLLELLGSG